MTNIELLTILNHSKSLDVGLLHLPVIYNQSQLFCHSILGHFSRSWYLYLLFICVNVNALLSKKNYYA